jgi:hypothetical protein
MSMSPFFCSSYIKLRVFRLDFLALCLPLELLEPLLASFEDFKGEPILFKKPPMKEELASEPASSSSG